MAIVSSCRVSLSLKKRNPQGKENLFLVKDFFSQKKGSGKGVRLSPVTSETHAPCCYWLRSGTHGGPLAISQRKVWATVGPYGLNPPGYTRPTMHATMGCNSERRS